MSFAALLTHIVYAMLLMLLSWLVTRYIMHAKIMDVPNARSSHSTPTPRGGGFGIVTAFMLGMPVILLFAEQTHVHLQYFWGFLLSALAIAAISFYDDIKNYPFHIKLFTQLAAVILVLVSGIVLETLYLPFLGEVKLAWFGYALTFIWMLGLTNAYNFMDGIDGLAASTAVIVSAFFAWITFHQGSHFIYLVSYTTLAGAAGFLLWNWPPAKIFMGDIGSTFLGFTFACMAIIAARYDMSQTTFLVMPMLLLHFIFDTVFTMSRRKLAGEAITQAHRTHIYQLLTQMNWSHLQVTMLYALLACMQGFAAIVLAQLHSDMRFLLFIPFVVLYAVAAFFIVRQAKRQGMIA